MANEMIGKLKTEWGDIPTWAKIGTGVAAVGLFILTKVSGTGTTAGTVAATTGASTPNSTGIVDLTPTSSTGGAQGSTDSTNINAPNSTFQGSLPSAAYNPIAQQTNPTTQQTNPADVFGTVPSSGLSPSQQSLQAEQIQSALGSYGGNLVGSSNPFANVGGGWADVKQSTYAGGGSVLNLGLAQPAPAVGQVIPPAVQGSVVYQPGTSIPDWQATLNNTYAYPANFSPGQVQSNTPSTIGAQQAAATQAAQQQANDFYAQTVAAQTAANNASTASMRAA